MEHNFAIWSSGTVHALEELSDRLFILDHLLHLTRGKVQLVGELGDRPFDEIFS